MSDTIVPSLNAEDHQALLRWRLALGPEAEKVNDTFGLECLRFASGGVGVPDDRLRELDEVLDFVYGQDRRGGSGGSRPNIPRWLAGLREFFRHDVVSLVQKDAIEKKGLTQLLFEPETLPFLEKNVSLVTMLLAAKSLIPEKAKDLARDIVREVVEELRKKLETQMRTAVIGALRRDQTSPLKVLRNLDWRRTIRQNLQGWDTERKRLVPRQMYFWANQRRHHEWDVAICVDQSGSMAESVVYSSVMAAIFASLDVLKTRLLFFDTEIVDVTPILVDPVEVLFSTQLGGGTDINRAVAYAQKHFVERPERTLFLLITDLFEGGNKDELLARMRQLVDSRVKAICLLALSDSGRPSYNHDLARAFVEIGVPSFGCTPKLLAGVVERLIKNQDLTPLIGSEGKA